MSEYEDFLKKLKEQDYTRYGYEIGKAEAEIIKKAIRKQIPKRPVMKPMGGFTAEEASVLSCPTCGEPVSNYWAPGNNPKHCQFCGQKLDWTPEHLQAIESCRDFEVLKASLTVEELETANRLCAEHDAGKCACDGSGEPDASHCLAARWLEGCIDTQDFIEELKAYG